MQDENKNSTQPDQGGNQAGATAPSQTPAPTQAPGSVTPSQTSAPTEQSGGATSTGSAPSAAQAKVPETGPKMVMISEEALKDLQAQMIALNKKVNETADRGRLQDFNTKQNKKVTPICRINFFRDQKGDRLIMGWGNMVSNKAKYGKNYEQVDQRTVLFLQDKTASDGVVAQEVDYVSFTQNKFQEEVEIIGKNELNDGRVIFKVLREDGEEIEMDSRFVN